MGIRPRFNAAYVAQMMKTKRAAIDLAIVASLRKLGNECVGVARDSGDYTDQTGNLRSSVGFLIIMRGKIVDSFFGTANIDQNGKGATTGRNYAEDLAKNYSEGFVLIVVAGMNYAATVESRSKDVLTSTEMYAEKQLPKILRSLKLSIKKM